MEDLMGNPIEEAEKATETVRSSNAMVTREHDLGSEATKAATPEDIIRALSNVGPSDAMTPAPSGRGKAPRRRRTKAQIAADNEAARKAALPPAEDVLRERREKAERTKARATELATLISGDLNDQLLSWVIAAGVPAQAIYKVPPVEVVVDTNLTPIGNALAIPPSLAKSAGRLVAELESTDSGAKLASAVEGGKMPLVVAGISTMVGAAMYGKRLQSTLDQFKPLIEAAQQAKKNAKRGTDNDDKENINGSTPVSETQVARGLA
jgi:hypothetical protein